MRWEWVREEEVKPSWEAPSVLARGDRPRGHTFSALLIGQAVELVLWANSSFRGAARSLAILGPAGACPSLWSIRNWTLRLGLFEVLRPKERARDWALILDHTIQLGPHKALLIVGVKLSEWERQGWELGHQDLAVLGLEILEQSNGTKVLESLEEAREQIGEPRLLISDGGSDLKKAVELFCTEHRDTDWIPDVSHRMARLLEAELKGDSKWESFLSQARLCRSQCQQTALYGLRPPPQRGKARWMNYLPVIKWGLNLLYNPVPSWVEPREYWRRFGWLDDYQEDLVEYCLLMNMGQEICRILKAGGIHPQALEECRERLAELTDGPRPSRHAAAIGQYLEEVESKLRPGERLLATSDIIESLFGKYKFLTERSPQKTITRLILSIGALVSKRTPDLVRQAMETVKTAAVGQWFRKYVGPSARFVQQASLG
jgi:hypothetical protein